MVLPGCCGGVRHAGDHVLDAVGGPRRAALDAALDVLAVLDPEMQGLLFGPVVAAGAGRAAGRGRR